MSSHLNPFFMAGGVISNPSAMLSIKAGMLYVASSSMNITVEGFGPCSAPSTHVKSIPEAFSPSIPLLVAQDESTNEDSNISCWLLTLIEEGFLTLLDPATCVKWGAGDQEEEDEGDDISGARKAMAASRAATCMSPAEADLARFRSQAESGKLSNAFSPRRARLATSCALAAISGVENVPSQILDFLFGSRTSHTHLLPFLRRTPLNTGLVLKVSDGEEDEEEY
ncbi:hypothetical protein RJ639_047510 [Escallonia herrerae]|uniref:Uncharacterized protein n=1 Tax=Escallonia herrerae TaxID=1293975 RepID=A0AA89B4J9_9ASTE|nr:hypothetical protein RJ639_047510 [Escallonia herrerae]